MTGQVPQGCATTTETVGRAIQHGQASLRALARRHGVSPRTVVKWRKRTSVADLPTGPQEARSSTLSAGQEAIIVAFRRHTPAAGRLPLRPPGHRPAPDALRFSHIDIAEVQTAEGKLHLLVAIDRTSKFAFGHPVEGATRITASAFLEALVAALPYRIHTVLTDKGRRARHRAPLHQDQPSLDQWSGRADEPDHQGRDREALPRRPPDQLRRHLADFVDACNDGRRLERWRGLTPCEAICKTWAAEPKLFTANPHHRMPGPNTWPETAEEEHERDRPA